MGKNKIFANILIVCIFSLALFFSLYKLNESPPTWMDEGIIGGVARVLSETGKMGIQIAPEEYSSASFVTTGITVIFPIAFVFHYIGLGLLEARMVMVIFIMAFLLFLYFFLKKDPLLRNNLIISLSLIATFPPLYGNGKNILGEVPGLVFLVLFLFLWQKKEKSPINKALLGFMLGATIVTKPIFILIVPALIVVIVFKVFRLRNNFKEIIISLVKKYYIVVIGLIIPIIAWIVFQLGQSNISSLLAVYSNPHHVDLFTSIISNLKLFVSRVEPAYCMIVFVIWLVSLCVRYRRKEEVSSIECTLFIFSGLMLVSFFRMPQYYRYLFLIQILSLVYLFSNVDSILYKSRFLNISKYIVFIVLFLANIYGLIFSSWVANSYNSHKTRDITNYFYSDNASHKVFFLYQVPELAIFVSNTKYYQYVQLAKGLIVGNEITDIVYTDKIDRVVTNGEYSSLDLFRDYIIEEKFDRYVILKHK